ncbi:MAG: hypothetical protein QOH35_3439 [Acidobacteriaceae bacterium]|nr:hypothetical protein [Acidobacteriaceae bacterium]
MWARSSKDDPSRNHLEARTVTSKADSSLEVGLANGIGHAAQRGHYAALRSSLVFGKFREPLRGQTSEAFPRKPYGLRLSQRIARDGV